jgi:Cytochrome C oxidase, cbb3-type, subunit III/Repeat of unknown function (DUF5648)
MSLHRGERAVLLACIATALALGPAGKSLAQSAASGKALYKTWCQVCHSVDPSTAVAPFNSIMSAANDPARITAAANADPSQMGFINTSLTPANLQDLAAYLGTFVAPPPAVPIVEFYSIARDHYFMSAYASEIADLDRGVHPGWTRTGASFNGYAVAVAGTGPVCRFYLPPASGDSHFYSASPPACTQLQIDFPAFAYETPNAYYIGSPDTVSGACAVGTIPVYRVWNARADTNHRYLTSATTRQQMLAAGWVAEGYGPDAVIMCAPP